MVFSSFPVYLDHSNLHQLQQSYHQQGTGLENAQIAAPGAPVGGGPGSIRPGSMVDRARLARIPLPENGLKCPRCDSTSTKFCYFNNYSLTQPRHFCKTCRRYWTRGGALRNVPVGGGCRKNKRSKNGGSKAAATSGKQSGGDSGNNTSNNDTCPNNNFLPAEPCIEYQASLSHYGGGGGSSTTTNIGSSIGGFIQAPQLVATNENNGGFGEMSFQLGNNNNNNFLSAEPWRLPASLAGFEPPSTNLLFPFQNEGIEASSSQQVKMEDSRNSTKQFLGAVGNNNQFWGGTWAGGFSGHLNSSSTSSSTTHLL